MSTFVLVCLITYQVSNCFVYNQIVNIIVVIFAIIEQVLKLLMLDRLGLVLIVLLMQLSLLILLYDDIFSTRQFLVKAAQLRNVIFHSFCNMHIFSLIALNLLTQHSLQSFIFILRKDNHKSIHFRPFLQLDH